MLNNEKGADARNSSSNIGISFCHLSLHDY